LVAKHIADFQLEISVAKQLQECKFAPPMPNGYPFGVYQPKDARKVPHVNRILHSPAGKMSNGVPWILGMGLVNQYTLGLYNPVRH
jgi:hypothetical protein